RVLAALGVAPWNRDRASRGRQLRDRHRAAARPRRRPTRGRVRRTVTWRLRSLAVTLCLTLPALAQESSPPRVEPPKLVEGTRPVYPEHKPASHERVSVLLELTLGAKGRAADALLVTPADPDFDQAALAAAKA